MSELPKGWVESSLAEISGGITYGFTTKSSTVGDGARLLRITDIQDYKVDWASLPYCDDQPDPAFLVRSGDIVVARTGATTGKSYLIKNVPVPTAFASYLIRIAVSHELQSDYVWKFMQGPDYWQQIQVVSKGTAQPGANAVILGQVAIPLPPLAEQERIVTKLDALNTKSARARTELARIETLVSRYKQAVLSKAFSGEFFSIRETGERREASKKRLSEICQSITDGDHQAPPKAPSGVPFITISAMNDGRIDLGKATRFVPESYYEELQSSRKARTGDILYSVTGSYGIPAIVETDRPFVFQRHISILRPDTSVASAKYLELLLASPEMRGQADAIATGTAQKTVPLKGLRNFEILIPSLEEQHEIVRRIESAFAKIDRLVKEAKRALELVGRLDEAILAKAFRGELVPQDDNDEPAEHLLARIRAEREAAPKGKRGRGAKG